MQEILQQRKSRFERDFLSLLRSTSLKSAPAGLREATEYALSGSNKRLRPVLVLEASRLAGLPEPRALLVAAAFECLHSYSLVHDDLPAMDNSDTRRGKPSLHKAYNEATAILAGDALLTLAFEIISDPETHEDPRVRVELIANLASAAGMNGMCGGQMLDLLGEKEKFDVGTISRMQRLKTGRLIAFCCEAGSILGRANPAHRQALRNYAHDLGLAFQVTDDLLDASGNTKNLGKPTGQDKKKVTFVSEMGIEQARMRAEMLVQQAIRHLHVFDEGRVDLLKDLAHYVLERRV